ncbi:GNAT family N-acetyltransferase [Paracoccus sp. 11-3]|uniref:GNAT family N-acetyltransferase n=1 Tax=Paracoccus amoyensis TaxID=2760093 RepID=A0A926GB86_9RHOB|nr:GNAT family N-acetyltransferase [Paracoccus amoyensis]MBC9245206.1 GNAT family N-acetyltransferase [Paracoccus amoyensis]
MVQIWQLGPDRAAEWRDIRLAALRLAPEAFDAELSDWQDRPLIDFADRLAELPTFAAGDTRGTPLAVASWGAGLDDRDPDRGWLFAVFCLPQARGRGYARAAIKAVMGDALQQGATSMGLNVVASNLSAQRLYHRLGFRPTNRQGVTNARGAPEIEMILSPLSAPLW